METSTRPPVALTTVFNPPPSCASTVTYDGTTFWQYGISQTGDPACYPPFFTSILNSYYSPGVCPRSWTNAGTVDQSRTVTHGSKAGIEYNGMCCPSGFTLSRSASGVLRNVCATIFTTDLANVFSTSSLQTGGLPGDAKVSTIRATDIAHNTIFADVIQIRWQTTDSQVIQLLGLATADSQSTSAVPSATSTVAPPTVTSILSTVTMSLTYPGPTSSPSLSNISQSKGISKGTKIGIATVIPLAVIAILLTALFCYRRRRKPTVTNSTKEFIYPAYPQIYEGRKMYTAAEIEGSNVPELADRTQVVQSPRSVTKPELPAGCL